MPWARLPVQGPVVPHAGGLLCLVPRQGAALHGHRSLGTSTGPGWQGLRDLPGFCGDMGHVDSWEGWEPR